jgi:glucuronate isomerase
MKPFMGPDFLLENETARSLYHESASKEPIFDYHCHLIPQQIAENKKFANLTEIWLGGDHYKWRAMRSVGIEERYITGDAEPFEKYMAWAKAMPQLLGNPLYHWSHLELQRYFGIHDPLNEQSAKSIWDKANEMLQSDDLAVSSIFKNFKVAAVGTTDDPADDLAVHEKINSGNAPIGKIDTVVMPSFRPDKAFLAQHATFAEYIEKLGKAAGIAIDSVANVKTALGKRLEFFVSQGCKASDHGIPMVPYTEAKESEVEAIFQKALTGKSLTAHELDAYQTSIMLYLGKEYARHGVVMQLHMNSIRNLNPPQFSKLGPDTGFDASHDLPMAEKLGRMLGALESEHALPKTVLYTLNPKDYYVLGSVMGAFQGDGIPGKIQLGSGWWFCDHKDGMEDQMKILGNLGSLPRFIGMLTDSRSFLSYPRHEYFRRILCNILGKWAEAGEIPADPVLLDTIVRDISFHNAQRYFA